MAKSSKAKQTTTFKEGQRLVYPLQGVGQVTSIEERQFGEKKLLYYIIYLEVSDMTVMVPVDKAEELGIRAIVNKKQSEEALDLVSGKHEPVTADWKMRYQMNHDLLKQGSVQDIATVVRSLYHRSKVKELPILERKLFDNALKLLVDEVSFSLKKSKQDIEKMVFERLKAVHDAAQAEAKQQAEDRVEEEEEEDFDEEL
ncbi:MAG: CarD family transcriptional regulator [Spirochaetota bacterium]